MNHLAALAALIEKITGNVIPEREMTRLEAVAIQRADASGQKSLDRYLRYLQSGGDSDEWRALLGHITVNESYLFRGAQQFRSLAEQVLPQMTHRSSHEPLTVWSAGCARGEEAATIAIVLAETLGLAEDGWRIVATDVDENVLDEARRGLFSPRAVARVAPDLLERWFTPRGKGYQLDQRLQERITYRVMNLVQDRDLPEAPADVIFLRNVLIYFRPTAQRRVVDDVIRSLSEHGVVFVGPSESLWQLRSSLEPVDLGDCFCYRLPKPLAPAIEPAAAIPRPGSAVANVLERPPRRSGLPLSERTKEGLEDPVALARRAGAALAAGNDSEAVGLVGSASRGAPDDATLRAMEGRVLALVGEPQRAVAAFRAALYLEPNSYPVRFLLAQCLHQLGRHRRTRSEIRAVIAGLTTGECRTPPALEALGVPNSAEIATLSRELLAETLDDTGTGGHGSKVES